MTPWTKRLAILLALSVGINLLLAGFLIGWRLGKPHRMDHGPDSGHAIAPGARRHPAMRTLFERHGPEFRERRDALRKARASAREALTRPQFDRAAAEQALATLKAETAKNQEMTHRALLEAAAEAEPEQRRELARALGPKGR